MRIEAVTPEEFMGDVIGDLNGKRGQIQEMNDRAGLGHYCDGAAFRDV